MPKPDFPVETLIEQLHSEDWTARCDAARLLGQTRDPRAVEALLPDLKDPDWRVRRNAAQALGALRDKRAVEPLLRALNDRTMTVRQRAIVALGRIKDPQAVPALLAILLANRHESYDADKAIRKFGKKALPEIAKAFERTNSQQLMMLLIEMKQEGAFELVLQLLESNEPSVQWSAIREMGNLGDQRAIPYLVGLLHRENTATQSESVQALVKLKATGTISELLDLLKDDDLYGPRASVYRAVTQAFQEFGGTANEIKDAFPGKYPPILNMGGASISLPEAMGLLGKDRSTLLNDAIARFQTGLTQSDEPANPIHEAVRKTTDDLAWKFGVMFADARDARQDHVKRLLELFDSESNLTRAAAALTLPWYGDERGMEPLKQLTQDSDPTVRTAATWAWNALQKAIAYRK
jgi:HEAT repeat protein